MQKQAFLQAVRQKTAEEMLRIVSEMDDDARQARAADAIKLYKQVDRFFGGGHGRAKDPHVLDADAAVVGVLGTASLSEILALKRLPVPLWATVTDLYSPLRPPWLQDALNQLLHPDDVLSLEPLWRDGICAVPTCDALIHGYFDTRQSGKLDEELLLSGLVWRFFETEGSGSNSLSRHDQFSRDRQSMGFSDRGAPWADRLLDFERRGLLDRSRLLSASLSAVGRLTRTTDIRWFAKLYASLRPSNSELESHRCALEILQSDENAARRAFGKRCLAALG